MLKCSYYHLIYHHNISSINNLISNVSPSKYCIVIVKLVYGKTITSINHYLPNRFLNGNKFLINHLCECKGPMSVRNCWKLEPGSSLQLGYGHRKISRFSENHADVDGQLETTVVREIENYGNLVDRVVFVNGNIGQGDVLNDGKRPPEVKTSDADFVEKFSSCWLQKLRELILQFFHGPPKF